MTAKQTDRVAGSRGSTCRTSAGNPCNAQPLRGTDPPTCQRHTPNPRARRNAQVRAEVSAWRVTDELVDPGVTLLRLLSQSARRAALYSLMLEQAFQAAADDADGSPAGAYTPPVVAENNPDSGSDQPVSAVAWDAQQLAHLRTPDHYPAGAAALVGNTVGANERFGFYAKGEEVRSLVRLEAEERERCARWAKMALDAGIAERQVRVLEQQAGEVVALIRRIIVALGLRPNSPEVAAVVTRELRALDAVGAA